LTTDGDRLGGAFAAAYSKADGPDLAAIVTLRDPHAAASNALDTLAMTTRLLGARGAICLARCKIGVPSAADSERGLPGAWPDALAGPTTLLLTNRDAKGKEFASEIESLKPDVVVSVGAPVVFGRRLLQLPSIGAINVHNALVPKYRGHFGTFWEARQGERWGYVCIHEMAPRVDSGRLLGWARIELRECSSFFDLMLRKKELGGQALARLLNEVKSTGTLPPTDPLPDDAGLDDGYYHFPTRREIMRFTWRRHHQAAA
jgi:folate-dependent phosphoribosylglycinamide formyltransferase PurN